MASSRVERFPVGEKINWQIGEMVGAGAFGRVYLGLNNDTGQLMAVKQVRRCSMQVLQPASTTVLLANRTKVTARGKHDTGLYGKGLGAHSGQHKMFGVQYMRTIIY